MIKLLRKWFGPKDEPQAPSRPTIENPLVIPLRKELYQPSDIIIKGDYTTDEYNQACVMLAELELTWGRIYSISSWGAAGPKPYSLQVIFREEQAEAAMLYKLAWGNYG